MTEHDNDRKITRAEQGAATRANILAAARQRFAADGYERATIRAIATDAEIDPSLVMRYFGSKQGLFVAAAEFDLHFPDLASVPREEAGDLLLRHFVELWEQDDILLALLRTATSNEDAAERMRTLAREQVVTAVAAVCDDERTIALRANLISSQFLGFAYCRYVLELPALAAMRTADVVRWLGPTIQGYLFGDPASELKAPRDGS